MKISAVVNTYNEERNITRCLISVQPYVDEIVVVDMHSYDKTITIVKKFTYKIFYHENVGYVEPARNFAIDKASGDWILMVDADEVLNEELGEKLRRLAEHAQYDFYRLPRKNIIFGKWAKHGLWPDYKIRFFKKGSVSWGDEIHSIPITEGKGMDLPAEEKNALVHYNYDSIEQFITRLNRYSGIEAEAKIKSGYEFKIKNLIILPTNEFLSRFFAWEGYKDGIHGLVLSLLQAISFLVVEIKCWEKSGFKEDSQNLMDELSQTTDKAGHDLDYWFKLVGQQSRTEIVKLISKIKSKIGG